LRIALISTGGTIAMEREAGRERASLSLEAGDLVHELSLSPEDRIERVEFSRLPSSHFDSRYARRLAERIHQIRDAVDGVVITHGTDTLEETAFYLEMVLPPGPPIVLTGAMVPTGFPGCDGPANLRDAIRVVKAPQSRGKGVLIVFQHDIIHALHGAKLDSERPNAFGSRQTGKMGAVNGDRVLYYYSPVDHVRLENRIRGKVSLVKLHYDIEEDLFDYACKTSDALVLECYGSGRVPPRLLHIMRRTPGTLFIATTRAFQGHLFDVYSYEGSYHDLVEAGAVISPLDSLKSCILVKLCMGNQKGPEEIREIFQDFFTH
jgi:L-asparaginase